MPKALCRLCPLLGQHQRHHYCIQRAVSKGDDETDDAFKQRRLKQDYFVKDLSSLFVGPEGSKQPQDLGINANMGLRLSANLGWPVSERLKIGLQVGAASNLSDAAVHVLDQINGPSHRTQTFLTAGAFQRPTPRLHYGLVYDLSIEHYYDDFTLGQWRGEAGYGVTADDEVGVWFTEAVRGADGHFGATALRLDPISQANFYTRHTWANSARTTVWLGIANGHDNIVWVFPGTPRDSHDLVYGAELSMPLSDRFAITGSANFIAPTATGTVDAFLGVTVYPGRAAMRSGRNTFTPVSAVANNPTMAINARR